MFVSVKITKTFKTLVLKKKVQTLKNKFEIFFF